MKINIHRTQNGAWVRFVETDLPNNDESIYRDKSYVFDSYKKDGDEVSGLHEMLFDILEDMGWVGDRHDRERIQIRLVHGDKFLHSDEDKAEDCRICKGGI